MSAGVAPDPWQLVARLREWAAATPWCSWLELAGSLGRGAGDAWSDVDAGLGVDAGFGFDAARDEALAAARGFGQVADSLVQSLGTAAAPAEHLIVQQRRRTRPASIAASPAQRREWAFLAWWALGDVAKHARRGSLWRALGSLDEARGVAWKLHAAALGVDYPGFGAVSVENAGLAAPAALHRTLPTGVDAAAIRNAAAALAGILAGLTADLAVGGVRQAAIARLTGSA